MTDIFAPIRDAIAIKVPEEHKRPIAIIGAGEITDLAHLPAYKKHGLEIVGLYDLNKERAEEVAQRHGIKKVYNSQEEVAEDKDVEVVDIAVFPWVQREIAMAMLDAGKHLLCQKPISYDFDEAKEIVAYAEKSKRLMAVNQQLRFCENIAAIKAMIDQGWIGDPFEIFWKFHVHASWEVWEWLLDLPQLELQMFTIHIIDATRFLFGDPLYIYGTQAREPGQREKGETRTISVFEYEGEKRAVIHSFNKNKTSDPRGDLRIDGTEGSIRTTFGLVYNYPHGQADNLELNSRVLPTDGWLPYPVTSRWIPDAFIGPMASLLQAIATDGVPETNGKDNLNTLKTIHSLYKSGTEHTVIKF